MLLQAGSGGRVLGSGLRLGAEMGKERQLKGTEPRIASTQHHHPQKLQNLCGDCGAIPGGAGQSWGHRPATGPFRAEPSRSSPGAGSWTWGGRVTLESSVTARFPLPGSHAHSHQRLRCDLPKNVLDLGGTVLVFLA